MTTDLQIFICLLIVSALLVLVPVGIVRIRENIEHKKFLKKWRKEPEGYSDWTDEQRENWKRS